MAGRGQTFGLRDLERASAMATGTTKKTTTKARPKSVPAGAKQPQDRRPAEVDLGKVKEFTIHGVDVSVPLEALDDFELLDDISEMEKGDATKMPSVLRRLVGDSYRELMNKLRDKKTGRVSIEAGGQLVADVLDILDPN